MVALTACMRKLLCLMVGVLNSNEKFNPDWVINQQQLAVISS